MPSAMTLTHTHTHTPVTQTDAVCSNTVFLQWTLVCVQTQQQPDL